MGYGVGSWEAELNVYRNHTGGTEILTGSIAGALRPVHKTVPEHSGPNPYPCQSTAALTLTLAKAQQP